MTLARMRSVVLDCPQPLPLAQFYQGVLGGDIEVADEGWVVLTVDGLRLAFQRAEDFAPPTWPTGERPQQFHLDVTVDDVEAVEPAVLALGATKHAVQPGVAAGDTFRVYLDPAGHPFCLCWIDLDPGTCPRRHPSCPHRSLGVVSLTRLAHDGMVWLNDVRVRAAAHESSEGLPS